MSAMMGLQQSFTGLGMLAGPILGSVLYTLGGFQCPFYVCGVALLLLMFSLKFMIKQDSSLTASKAGDDKFEVRLKQFSIFGLLMKPKILLSAVSVALSLTGLTFKEPILQLRLRDFQLSVMLVGLVFSLDTISFFIMAVIQQKIKEEKKNFFLLLLLGCIAMCLSTIFQGPWPWILPDEVGLIAFGILIGGIGGSLININSVPAMNAALFKKQTKTFKDSKQGEMAKNNIAAINTGAFALGSIIGPVLGSVLEGEIGYRLAFFVIGVFFILYTLVMLLFFLADRKKEQRRGVGSFDFDTEI